MTILRALAAASARALPDRLPMQGRSGVLSGLGNILGGSATSGMEAYANIGAAYGPVHRIATAVALTDWSLYQQTETAGKVDRELVDDATAPARHPATALWTQPNPYMTRRTFLFLHQLLKITCGGVYWLICQGGKDGSPFPQPGVTADIELWPIRADRIQPIPDPDNYIAGYVYSQGIEKIPLPVQAIIPIGWPDPRDPLKFAGPLQSVSVDLESEQYAAQYQRNTFLNSAEPGGVIQFDAPLPQDRFEELVLRWREQHQGLNNAKRVAIIEGGKWITNGQSNRDLEFEKLRRLSPEQIMYVLGMPYSMMLTQDVNLANAQTGEKVFYRWTLRPELEDIKEPLNLRVLPYFGDLYTMDYTLPAPEDEAFDTFQASAGFIGGYLRLNEARAATGYDADPEGDVFSWQITGMPPKLPPATPPKKPTTLSYRGQVKRPDLTRHENGMTDLWAQRLHSVQRQYLDFLDSKNR